jgi:uncharacterized membrane protein YfcA
MGGGAEAIPMGLGGIAALSAVALAAGVVDAVAGGGGLITVPALVAAGLPPHLAIATNKGQSVFGAASALAAFWRAGLVEPRRARVGFPLAFAGSIAGSFLVLLVRPEVLRPVVLVLLAGTALVVGLRRGPPRPEARVAPARALPVAGALALVLGTYDGFFGPGTGTFLIAGFVALLGDTPTRASASAKVVNFASNLSALLLFAWKGAVVWKLALPMAAAQLLGGQIGARLAVRKGDVLVRRAVLVVVLALCAKLARDLWMAR